MDYLVISPSDECLDPERPYRSTRFSLYGNSPTTYDGSSDYFSTEHSHNKFIIGSFIPLPSIIASPACTPSTSSSGGNTFTDGSLSPPETTDDYKTAPSSPAVSQVCPAPTCIYTPPTPPPKTVKRSVTCFARPQSQLPSFASFPASISPHENRHIMKRSASVPTRSRPLQHAAVQNFANRDAMNPSASANLLQRTLIASLNAGKSNPRKLSMRRTKAIFHIANDHTTDIEDDSPEAPTTSPELLQESPVANNLPDSEPELSWLSEKAKDDLRRCYALNELLGTEVGYLMDLRALVNVYLRLLPSLVCRSASGTSFSRASSFTSSPWASANGSQMCGPTTLSDTNNSSTVSTRENARPTPRSIFSDQEIDVLTRNAHELLHLHEQFVEELRSDLLPLGFRMDSDHPTDDFGDLTQTLPNTDAAIHSVSTKFATEASRFASYESFCAGHPEALDLTRKAQAQHPVEWDAFEQKCAALIQNMEYVPSAPSRAASEQHSASSEENGSQEEKCKDRTRASSLSSVEGAVRTLRRRTSNISSKESSPLAENGGRRDKGSRLAFDDYLIKPIQRICKYPLIMDQLKHGRSLRSNFPAHTRTNTEVVVDSAAQAMRHVATAVDEARRKQDIALQSSRIASRLVLSISSSPTSVSPVQALNQVFMSSLGTCSLAGSLDVIHIHSSKSTTSSISAKYLGAFLYPGGYLILAKVSKAKVYEPKHWFSLGEFEISEVEEDDAMLPCSIRLTSKEHRFELAAACQREKDLWFTSIQEAQEQDHHWVDEPIASIQCDGKGELIPSTLDDGPFELVNALPTIQSIPELANSPSSEFPEPMSATSSESSKPRSPKLETGASRRDVEPPSRRSSTASVKAIFSPNPADSDTIVIRRSSASARSRVDQGLQDVISQPCLKARSHAFIRDEELFQMPKASKSGFVRSQSGLSVASLAKGRLTRHESFRIVRRKSLLESSDAATRRPSSIATMGTTPRRNSRSLQLTTMQLSASPQSSSPSSSFLVNSLSSLHGSVIKSPTRPASPVPPQEEPSDTLEAKPPIKTSRSLVSNVREFFSSRSLSTTPPSRSASAPGSQAIPSNEGSPRKLWKPTLHRRTQSTTDWPEDPVSLPAIEKLPPLDLGTAMTTLPLSQSQQTRDKPSGPKSLLAAPICISPNEIDQDHSTSQHRSLLQCMTA